DDARADLVEVRRGNVDRLEGDSDEGGNETVARLLAPMPGPAGAFALVVFWAAACGLLGIRLLLRAPRWSGLVAAICFGGALLSALVVGGAVAGRGEASPEHVRAERLRGFGLLGLLAIVLILAGNLLFVPLSAILVLLWAWASRTPWQEIGFVRPRSWIASIALAVVFGSAFKL